MDLQVRLGYCFPLIIEHTVAQVGFCKAVHLRRVSRSFDDAVIFALCVRHVVEYDDKAIEESLRGRIPLTLKARIFLHKSRKPLATQRCNLLAAIVQVNARLDGSLAAPTDGGHVAAEDEAQQRQRHLLVAEAVTSQFPTHSVNHHNNEACDASGGAPDGKSLLCGAIVVDNITLVRSLLLENDDSDPAQLRQVVEQPNASPSKWFGLPLSVAAAWGRAEIVELLLGRGLKRHSWADLPSRTAKGPDAPFVMRNPRSSALRAAALGGHEAIVRRLLLLEPEYRVPLSSREYRGCVADCARGGHVGILRLLLSQVEFDGTKKLADECPGLVQDVMMEACLHGREAVVRYMLEEAGCGLNLNTNRGQGHLGTRGRRGPYGCLNIAAAQGNARLVRLLLDAGADPRKRDLGSSQTPILGAARCGQDEVVDLLLERGACCGGGGVVSDDEQVSFGDVMVEAAMNGQERLVRRMLARMPQQPEGGGGYLATTEHYHCREDEEHPRALGTVLLGAAIDCLSADLVELLVRGHGVPLDTGWGEESLGPLLAHEVTPSRWMCGLLLSLGAQGRMIDRYEEAGVDPDDGLKEGGPPTVLGGIRLSMRTWKWVGKH